MARHHTGYLPGTLFLVLGLLLLWISGRLWQEPPAVRFWSARLSTARFVPHAPTQAQSIVHSSGTADSVVPVAQTARTPGALAALQAVAGKTDGPKGTIVVIGATGLSGSEAVYQALQRGYKVVGLARTPTKLVVPIGSGGAAAGQPLSDANLRLVQGSVVNIGDVRAAFEADDIVGVVVALGGRTSEVGKTMLTDGTQNVIEVMKAKGVKRIAVITSIGTGDSVGQAPFFFRVLMATVMSSIFKDKNNQESLFIAGPGSDLEYTLVRPGGLTVGPPTGVINVIDGEAGSIARADVASFCLDAILDSTWKYIRKAPCISSVGGTAWTKDRSAAARGGM